MRLENFLVPLRATLTVALPAKESAGAAGGGGGEGAADDGAQHEPFPNSGLRISHFDERVDVYPSKAKPKKISLCTTGGAKVRGSGGERGADVQNTRARLRIYICIVSSPSSRARARARVLKKVRFLVKKEQHGDLRKDARLMEVPPSRRGREPRAPSFGGVGGDRS